MSSSNPITRLVLSALLLSLLLAAIVVADAAASLPRLHDRCLQLAQTCNMRFGSRGPMPHFSIRGPALMPISPRLRHRRLRESLGAVNASLVATLAPNNLTRDAPASALVDVQHVVRVMRLPYSTGSGLAHEVRGIAPRRALFGQCVCVFVDQFDVLDRLGRTARVVRARDLSLADSQRLCAVFKVSWY